MSKRIIVTGGAGFIGSNLCDFLLKNNHDVVCIDSFDDYYDPEIKRKNLSQALTNSNFTLIESDIKDIDFITKQISGTFDAIIHLAAKAGVRDSLKYPERYFEANVNGTASICELATTLNIPKIIFSSSSSVYGNNPDIPWSENSALQPLCPYALSKIQAEELLQKYATKKGSQIIILRLFSVYGNRMRPDLMMDKIYNNLISDKPLSVFGDGSSQRDYTYIDDIISGIYNSLKLTSNFEIINLGNSYPIRLNEIIHLFEEKLEKISIINHLQAFEAEPSITYADIRKANKLISYNPITKINDGINLFCDWKLRL